MSVGLAKAATLLAALDPFVPAATILNELTGQRLGDRTIHRVARKVGKAASNPGEAVGVGHGHMVSPDQGHCGASPKALHRG